MKIKETAKSKVVYFMLLVISSGILALVFPSFCIAKPLIYCKEPPVLFSYDSLQYKMRFQKDKVNFAVMDVEETRAFVWNLTFRNANEEVILKEQNGQVIRTSYTYSGVRNPLNSDYTEIWYRNIYKQVDVHFYGNPNGTIQYDFVVKPSGKVADIQLDLEGVTEIEIAENGELVMKSPLGQMRKRRPYAYQIIKGAEVKVEARFVLTARGYLTFEVGDYNPKVALVID